MFLQMQFTVTYFNAYTYNLILLLNIFTLKIIDLILTIYFEGQTIHNNMIYVCY